MNELQQTQIELTGDSLPVPMAKNEKQGIKGVYAKDAELRTLRNTVKSAVLRAYASTNREETKTNLTFIVDGLKDEILRVFPGVRLEEIGLAIHKGAMGEYEKIYTLSLATFVSFIRAYLNSDLRQKALLESQQQTKMLLPEHKPSEQELAEMRVKIALEAFETFKNSTPNNYNDHGNYVFDVLANIRAINFTEDEVHAIWKQARKNVFQRLFSLKGGIAHGNEKKQKIYEVKNNPDHYLFYMEGKTLGLKLFFANLIIMGVELKDLLENGEV